MNGLLNVNKPYGQTSYDVVAQIKRWSGERHVGHAGTLDPMATGVLPVCLGQATRVVEFLMGSPKTYRAEIELGLVTDTYDAEGQVIRRGDVSGITLPQVESSLASFRGSITQIPPPYSAVKHQGKPLYRWARAGIPITAKSRPAEIYDLEILDWQAPVVTIEVRCGKGTYIRSLAYDLGEKLGCGATLKSLVRSKYGCFDVREALSLSQLEDAFHHGYWSQFIYPVDSVLLDWPAIIVGESNSQRLINGRHLPVPENQPASPSPSKTNYCRAYSTDGYFLAVLHYEAVNGEWHPDKVFLK